MIAVDTNLLVYAHRREVSEHGAASATLRGLAEGRGRWGIPWPCVYEFYSVVTNPRIWKGLESSPKQAWDQISAWLLSPSLLLLAETDDFFDVLEGFLTRPRVKGPIVHDARVAALCVAHGVRVLLTRDRDFGLFPELRTENPLS